MWKIYRTLRISCIKFPSYCKEISTRPHWPQRQPVDHAHRHWHILELTCDFNSSMIPVRGSRLEVDWAVVDEECRSVVTGGSCSCSLWWWRFSSDDVFVASPLDETSPPVIHTSSAAPTILTSLLSTFNVNNNKWSRYRQKAASPPHMDGSVVFARLRQCAPPSNACFLGPRESTTKRHLDRCSGFCKAH